MVKCESENAPSLRKSRIGKLFMPGFISDRIVLIYSYTLYRATVWQAVNKIMRFNETTHFSQSQCNLIDYIVYCA